METEQSERGVAVLHGGCVILVDNDASSIDYLTHIFSFMGCTLKLAADPEALQGLLGEMADTPCTAIVAGTGLDETQAARVAELASAQSPRLPVFLAVNASEIENQRPVGGDVLGSLVLPTNFEVLINLMHKAQVFVESQDAANQGRRPLELFRSLSGNSRGARRIDQMIQQVANTEATVLILGESGTGKEVVARKLHFHSGRRNKPFVPVNCGAIPADLLESELFGHEKGSFTGAISARKGRFEMAEGGTLFLDEIGDMSMPMQVKLLRVLQERTFERVGSNKTIHCDVRILAATHRDLEKAIEEGNFREDLFYRLNVFPIDVPPLRERTEDIPLLVKDLINRIEHEKRGSVRLTPGAVTALCHYHWPGNVRELANLIERLAILFPYGVVDVADLPEKFRADVPPQVLAAVTAPEISAPGAEPASMEQPARLPTDGLDLKAHLSELEMGLIRQALDEADGVVAHAAKLLKMRRTTLVEKLRKYGLQRDGQASAI